MKRWTATVFIALFTVLVFLSSRPGRCQEPARLKVLTFNVWGIIGARERNLRMEAIGRKVAALDPDVIAIEEAFEGKHRKILLKSLENNGCDTSNRRYFRNVYGSGLLFISRFPIEEAVFEKYRVIGGARDIEWLGGKGIAWFRLKTPWGPLDFFHTHAIARMTKAFDAEGNYMPGDPKQVDRLLHMHQIDRFVRTHKSRFGRSIIAAGDFNVSPEMLEYQFLVKKTGFENSFDLLHPGENPSTFATENIYVDDEYSRIDHVFFKNYEGTQGFWVRPVESRVEMADRFANPENMKDINYSDHYAVWTEFEVITEDGSVAPSPEGVLSGPCECDECPLEGYDDGVIELSAANYQGWEDLALAEFRESFKKQKRQNQLLIPLAEIVAAHPAAEPATIEIPAELVGTFERDVCAQRCSVADN
jgi:endonuclease/exonuclease/phosphatase family metal-dependent hydrolase